MTQEQKTEAVIAYCYMERYPGFQCYECESQNGKAWDAVGTLLATEAEARAALHKLRYGDGPVTQLQKVEAELAAVYAARSDMQYYSEVDEIARDLARKLDAVQVYIQNEMRDRDKYEDDFSDLTNILAIVEGE